MKKIVMEDVNIGMLKNLMSQSVEIHDSSVLNFTVSNNGISSISFHNGSFGLMWEVDMEDLCDTHTSDLEGNEKLKFSFFNGKSFVKNVLSDYASSGEPTDLIFMGEGEEGDKMILVDKVSELVLGTVFDDLSRKMNVGALSEFFTPEFKITTFELSGDTLTRIKRQVDYGNKQQDKESHNVISFISKEGGVYAEYSNTNKMSIRIGDYTDEFAMPNNVNLNVSALPFFQKGEVYECSIHQPESGMVFIATSKETGSILSFPLIADGDSDEDDGDLFGGASNSSGDVFSNEGAGGISDGDFGDWGDME